MIPVIFNGAPAFLIEDAPAWDFGLAVEATLPASYERGLTGRETRRATAGSLRLACKFTAVIQSVPAITRLRNALQGLNVQPVLCPFHPALFAAGDAPLVTAALPSRSNWPLNVLLTPPRVSLPANLPVLPSTILTNPELAWLGVLVSRINPV